jgi:hypothetical protein
MFDYTLSDAIEQINALPLGMLIWIRTLGFINTSSIFLLRRSEARWVLAAFVFIAIVNPAMMAAGTGLVKLLGIPHLVVWIPLVAYLAVRLRSGQTDIRSPFGAWCAIVMLVNLISVVFDLRDGVQFVLGDRGVVTGPAPDLPIPTLLAIAVSATALVMYATGFGRDRESTQTDS